MIFEPLAVAAPLTSTHSPDLSCVREEAALGSTVPPTSVSRVWTPADAITVWAPAGLPLETVTLPSRWTW